MIVKTSKRIAAVLTAEQVAAIAERVGGWVFRPGDALALQSFGGDFREAPPEQRRDHTRVWHIDSFARPVGDTVFAVRKDGTVIEGGEDDGR